MEDKKPERKTLRHNSHDYNAGFYFLTICTKEMKPYFGCIVDGIMQESKIGTYVNSLLMHYISCGNVIQYVLMPNHIHLIVEIHDNDNNIEERNNNNLSKFVGALKKRITLYAKAQGIKFYWQRSFYDRIIRNMYEAYDISKYIDGNIPNWDTKKP